MIDIKCAQCSSTEVQKASVIYEGGTSTGSSFGGGSIGGRGAIVSSVSTSQTKLAKKLAPPPRMGFGLIFGHAVGILFIGALSLMNFKDGNGGWGFLLLVNSLILGILLLMGFKRNAEYPAKFEKYDKSWYCHKCGTVSQIG